MTLPQSQTVAIDIAGPLKCSPADIEKYLAVKVGTKITLGMTLAEKHGFLGMEKIQIQSPTEGLVTGIDTEKGQLIVETGSHDQLQLESGAETTTLLPETTPDQKQEPESEPESKPDPELQPEPKNVQETEVEQQVEVTEQKEEVQDQPASELTPTNITQTHGLFGFGEGRGQGWLVEEPLKEKSLIAQMKGRVVITPYMPSLTQMYKASAIGVTAIVTNAESHESMMQSQQFQKELEGKVRLGFLLLPAKVNLATLHSKYLQVLGKELLLNIEE